MVERTPTDGAFGATDYITDYTYGAGGWLAESQSPDNLANSGAGSALSYAYDAVGEQTQVTDAAGDKTRYAYDAAGHTVKTTRADGSYTTATYDEAGRESATAVYSAGNVEQAWTQALLDNDGKQICAEKPVPGTAVSSLPSPPTTITTSNYTTACVASSGYDLTQFQYDATGLLTGEIQPTTAATGTSITISYGHDLNGDRTAYTDGNGNATYTTYNAWQQQETVIEPTTSMYTKPGDQETTTSYNADGAAIQATQPGGVTLGATYNGTGELTQETGSGASAATATRSFTYNPDGALLAAATSNTLTGSSSNATSESFSYDDRGDLLNASGSAGTSSFTYNGDSLLTSAGNTVRSTPQTTSYSYDNVDRVATLKDAATGTLLNYAYSPSTDTQTIGYGSGGDVRTVKYNALGELSSDTLATASGATVKALTYGWDVDGNLTAKSDTAGTSNTYTYDQAGRLASWTAGSATTNYAYDADSNRTQVGSNVYTYDTRDELTSDGVNTYTYTANGDLSAKQNASTGTAAFTDDAYGQQITAGSGAEQYTYDAAGRTLAEANTGSGGTTTTLTYQGTGNEIAYDGTHAYTRTPSGSLIGASTAGGATLLWADLHTDVVGTFGATSTMLTGTETYDPLGNVLANTGTTARLSVGYQSEYTDAKTGEVNMAARWYNPATGQFLNRDTVTNPASPNTANANPFAYANGSPLTATDPSGHRAFYDDGNNRYAEDTAAVRQTFADMQYETDDVIGDPLLGAYANTADERCAGRMGCYYGKLRELSRVSVTKTGQLVGGNGAISILNKILGVENQPDDGSQHCSINPLSWGGCVHNAESWINRHPLVKDILSVTVGAATAFACTAVTGMAVGCAMLGGAAMTGFDYAVTGDATGRGSVTGLIGTMAVGAVASGSAFVTAGAVSGPLMAGARALLGDGLGAGVVSGALTGGVSSGVGGAVLGAGSYAGACGSGGGCSWSGLVKASVGSAVVAAAGGAGFGALAAVAGRSAGAVACSASSVPHSFTGSTPVLMADGGSKPIDQVKVGDKIADSVPGQSVTQGNTVTGVIVTSTDHDFVDVGIAPVADAPATTTAGHAESGAVPAAGGAKPAGLKKAALALAAVLALSATGASRARTPAPRGPLPTRQARQPPPPRARATRPHTPAY